MDHIYMDAVIEQLLEQLLGPLLGLDKHQDRRLQPLLYQIPTGKNLDQY
jgi:hypothetical protein